MARGHRRAREDRCEFISFLEQRLNGRGRSQARLFDDLEPIAGFVGFFLNQGDLGDEIRVGSRPAGRSIIRSH